VGLAGGFGDVSAAGEAAVARLRRAAITPRPERVWVSDGPSVEGARDPAHRLDRPAPANKANDAGGIGGIGVCGVQAEDGERGAAGSCR
jgi:hypothetical protein